jgi:hypothetical protein
MVAQEITVMPLRIGRMLAMALRPYLSPPIIISSRIHRKYLVSL